VRRADAAGAGEPPAAEAGRARARLPIVAAPAAGAPPHAAPDPDGRRELRDADLHALLATFYEAVELDPLLAPYFADVDLPAHLPRIVDFWSTLVFHTGRYAGNAFRPHLAMPGLTAEHFGRWLATLERTVDARFAGADAARMKELAHRVATSMQLRLGIVPGA
jgi:hemoglobin